MTVPASPDPSKQAKNVLDELAGEQDGTALDMSPQSQTSTDVLLGGHMYQEPVNLGEIPAILPLPTDICGSLGMAPWPAVEEEEYLARQHNHYLRKGLRTPSSFGSRSLCETPTEVPSPRIVEADSNQGSVYQDGSSEDTNNRHALDNDGLKARIKEMSVCLADVATGPTSPARIHMPTIEQMGSPLALEMPRFSEAPCPLSPCRVPQA